MPWRTKRSPADARAAERRQALVAAVRTGTSMRAAARAAGVSLLTVQRWVARAAGAELALVDWTDRSSAPHHQPGRIAPDLEAEILRLRIELQRDSVLGEYGAPAIARELRAAGLAAPATRTIGRVLARHGVLDARGRIRRPAPPRGWYLPAVAAGTAELDLVDSIVGLQLRGGVELEVLTLISLHGGLPGAWVRPPLTTPPVIAALLAHWQAVGLPGYVQFDNAMIFAGSYGRPDLGRIARLCLTLGISPVFVPPREMGFQAAIESFNGRWQAKLWRRVYARDRADLDARSTAFVAACRRRSAARIEAAPARRPFPTSGLDLSLTRPHGRVIYLRRTNERGEVTLLRQRFALTATWPYRLVRAEVDLDAAAIRFYALRRRDPSDQPLLAERPFVAPWPASA